MGSYTDRLFRRNTKRVVAEMQQKPLQLPPDKTERLVEVAIMLADGEVVHGFRTHYELRHSLGWSNPAETRSGTRDGFWTDKERFVTRVEAKFIGYESGQVQQMERELLSSDVQWER